jgi:thioredoxin 1
VSTEAGDPVVELTDDTFDELINNSTKPYLVDFWAEWCGPCVALEPIVREIATEQHDRINVGRLDTIKHPKITERFNVMSVPTLLIFKDGEVVKRIPGGRNKRVLLAELENHLTD